MKRITHLIAALAAATLLFGAGLAAAQAQSTLDQIKANGTVRIGMLVDFPPYGLLNDQNQPDGYDADVAKLLAQDLGVKLQIVQVTGPNRIPYLLGGRVDLLVASLGITKPRSKRVDYSQPYAAIVTYVYGQTDVKIPDADALAGKTVGVARGSTQDAEVTAVAPDSTTIQRYPSDASAVQALLSGQVPLIGVSDVVINEINKRAPGRFDQKFSLDHQFQGIAVRPDNDQLRHYLDKFVAKIKANGELDAIHEKWLNSPLPKALSSDAPAVDIPNQ